jgi:hypothetical protein
MTDIYNIKTKAMNEKLEQMKRQLEYFIPTGEWQPQKYNTFLHKLETIIADLTEIENLLKADKSNSNHQQLIKKVSSLLERYTAIREKYY